MKEIRINTRVIGEGHPPYFVADIASNHDGDLRRALMLIERAKEAGADAAKFQNFHAATIVSKYGFEAMDGRLSHQKSWGKPVFEVYRDASVPLDWTEKLKKKCDEVGIEYFTSPYDFESVDYVDPYVNVYKIGSGDITWIEMIEYIARKHKPLMIATGASTMQDVARAMSIVEPINNNIVLMQCNTNYTANPENLRYVNLNVLSTFRERFPEAVLGLSDHTHGHATVTGAVALGARVFEKHFTDDNGRQGPDHTFAMNPNAWRAMVTCVNEVYQALGDGVKRVEANEQETAIVQRRALRFVRDISEGEYLRNEDLIPLRPIPDDGIAPYEISCLIGRRLRHDVKADDSIHWEDIG